VYEEQTKALKRMYAARDTFTAERGNSEAWWRLLSDLWNFLNGKRGQLHPFLQEPTAAGLAEIKKGLVVNGEHYGSCEGGTVVLAPGYGPKYQHQRLRRKELTQDRIEHVLKRGAITCDCAFLIAELDRYLAEATTHTAKGWEMPGKYALHKLMGVKARGWSPVDSWDTRVHNDTPAVLAKAASFADLDAWMIIESAKEYEVSQGTVTPVLASPSALKMLDELVSGKATKAKVDVEAKIGNLWFGYDDAELAKQVRNSGDYSALPRHTDNTWNWGKWHFVPDTWLELIAKHERCEMHIIDHNFKKIPDPLEIRINKLAARGATLQMLTDCYGGFLGNEGDDPDSFWVKRFADGIPTPLFFQELAYVHSFRFAGRKFNTLDGMSRELLANFDGLHMHDILLAYHMMLGAFAAAGIDQMMRKSNTDFFGECVNYIIRSGEDSLTGQQSPVLADFAIYFRGISAKLKEMGEKSTCMGTLWSVRGMFVHGFLGALHKDNRWSLMVDAGPSSRMYYTD